VVQPSVDGTDFLKRRFFPKLSLNYARCLLDNGADPDRPAVTVEDESGAVNSVSHVELTDLSMRIVSFLKLHGVTSGDRVVAIAKNSVESIAACIACAALGASWSSVAPELGAGAIVERFGQLEPVLLFANASYSVNGTHRDITDCLNDLLSKVSSIQHIALLSDNDAGYVDAGAVHERSIHKWSEIKAYTPEPLESLKDFPFDHPLFVLFSSGTTGAPKCIVHGAGGTLLEHLKEHRLHSSLSKDDTLLFQTSTGWMMWNWQLSALASGTHIVLYDGSVSYPDKTQLLKVISDHSVTVFGTSPAYIQFLIESGVTPKKLFAFPKLRAVQSTGSVLYESQFVWIKEHFKSLPVQSVSGGTDMIGCLVLGHPDLDVHDGDSQCISLGIDVRVKIEESDSVERAGTGELVVVKPFPSQPVYLWNDPDQCKILSSYFEANPTLWTHGDQIRITADGSPRILGRSDGTLNIRGVRIGPAEILTIVNSIEGVVESMAIEQSSPREPGGSRLVLLLVMQNDQPLERPFILQLKKRLATEASRLHVPSEVVVVTALPRTHNGKLSEKVIRCQSHSLNLQCTHRPSVHLQIDCFALLLSYDCFLQAILSCFACIHRRLRCSCPGNQ